MTDIIELTERALQSNDAGDWRWHMDQLVAALKAARAENERLMENCRQWKKLFDEVTGISPDDVALLQKLADQ